LGQLVHRAVQGTVADPKLNLQLAERDAKDIVLHRHMGEQTVAKQALFENTRGARTHLSTAARTVFLL